MPQTVGGQRRRPVLYWGASLLCLLLLAGCSRQRDISYSQEQLNQLVSTGYLAPQMRAFDFQPLLTVQLYLDKPELRIQDDMAPLRFQFAGKLDAQILGGSVLEFLPVRISGQADLHFNADDQAIYLNNIQLQDTVVNFDVMLINAMVIEQLQQRLVVELGNIPVITLSRTPKLEEYLANAGSRQSVNIFSFEQKLWLEIEDIRP